MNGLQRSRRTREPKPATSTATSTGSAPCAVLTSAIRAVMHDSSPAGVVGPNGSVTRCTGVQKSSRSAKEILLSRRCCCRFTEDELCW